MKIKNQIIILSIIASMVLFSCGDSGETDGSGKLNVQMTDAPFPTDLVAEANVTISKIEVRQAGAEEDGEEDGGSPFITVLETEVSANLLDLTNGVTANLASVEIPEGSYDLVRLYVSDASILLKDGTSYDNLFVPSGAQTGIKVFVAPAIDVVGGLTAELLLDVDVAASFVPQGNLDSPAGVSGFIFTPVIKATNNSVAGRVQGSVTAEAGGEAVEGATVSVYAEDTLNTSTFTDADGNYAVLGLVTGLYDLTVDVEGFAADTTENVEIVAANATTADFQLTAE